MCSPITKWYIPSYYLCKKYQNIHLISRGRCLKLIAEPTIFKIGYQIYTKIDFIH